MYKYKTIYYIYTFLFTYNIFIRHDVCLYLQDFNAKVTSFCISGLIRHTNVYRSYVSMCNKNIILFFLKIFFFLF